MPILRGCVLLSVVSCAAMASGVSAQRTAGGAIPELTHLFQTIDGTTSGGSNFVSTLNSAACSGISSVPGPDVVYTWLAQTGNPNFPRHLDFFVTPAAGFDAVVYALSELDNGASCVAAVDLGAAGVGEMLHVDEQLVPGQRYYLYIDSRNGSAISGAYRLYVSTFIGVELQRFTIE